MALTIHAYQLVRKAAAEDMKNVFAQPLPHQHKEASNNLIIWQWHYNHSHAVIITRDR